MVETGPGLCSLRPVSTKVMRDMSLDDADSLRDGVGVSENLRYVLYCIIDFERHCTNTS